MLLAGQFATAPKVLELIWALDRKLTGESLQADQSDMLPRGNWAARVTVTVTAGRGNGTLYQWYQKNWRLNF